MLIMRNLNLISVQIWTYLLSSAIPVTVMINQVERFILTASKITALEACAALSSKAENTQRIPTG